MNLENPNNHFPRNTPKNSFLSSKPLATPARHMSLSSPMIDRVHKAKAGCSACGKKVA